MNNLLLEMRGIVKRFPGVLAVNGGKLELRPGEVHCLVGENGAGKSTLMKILAGAIPLDEGDIRINGEAVEITSPSHAQQLGVAMIYQEFNLNPYMSVAENIYLGRPPRWKHTPLVDWPRLYRETEELLARVRLNLDGRKAVQECSIAQQQMIEIAKALSVDAGILVMDEPSATLTDHELNALFDLIRHLKTQSIGTIYISHRLEEIFAIGDRVTVMRDGQYVATHETTDVDREQIIHEMVGRDLTEEFPKITCPVGPERLRVEKLSCREAFNDVSFMVHGGEIVGLTGLVGAGRTEVARAIFGADPLDEGQVYVDGEAVSVRSPREAIRQGIALLTEDRKGQGLVLDMSLRHNTTLARLKGVARGGLIRQRRETEVTEEYVRELRIRTPSVEQITRNLSGGNQQKVVLAKWLFTESRVLIFDEPTRGVDVGAKVEIYRLMNTLIERGAAVLMISSELPEILGMCDRILVMHEGRLAGELSREEATQERIMQLATGTQMTAIDLAAT